MKNVKISWDIVIISALITILIIILFTGFLIAEKNTQKIGFSNSSPFFYFVNSRKEKFMQLKYMGKLYKFDFYPIYNLTDKISKYVYDYLENLKNNLFLHF